MSRWLRSGPATGPDRARPRAVGGFSRIFALDHPRLTIPFLTEVVAGDMAAVDAVLRASLDSDVALVRRIADYIVGGGGKRLRPILLLLAANALGHRGTDHHRLAAVIEMIHTATLLHDDVVDASAQRRGRPTANAAFGNAAAVLVGDFLYSRAFQIMVATGRLRVLEILADATNEIAQGEVLQLMNVGNLDVDEDAYVAVIRRKTAKLFEAAARIGAVLGGAAPAQEDALARYGMHLGIAFQMQDDVLDYEGDAAKLGKNLGDDLAEGKMTLPLIHALAHAPAGAAAFVRATVDSGEAIDFARVHALLASTGALDYARERARRESQAAAACLAELPQSREARTLLQLSAFAVDRDF
jgi:octaprenyl-diphosphate synthase